MSCSGTFSLTDWSLLLDIICYVALSLRVDVLSPAAARRVLGTRPPYRWAVGETDRQPFASRFIGPIFIFEELNIGPINLDAKGCLSGCPSAPLYGGRVRRTRLASRSRIIMLTCDELNI